jgi:hypothetical protein
MGAQPSKIYNFVQDLREEKILIGKWEVPLSEIFSEPRYFVHLGVHGENVKINLKMIGQMPKYHVDFYLSFEFQQHEVGTRLFDTEAEAKEYLNSTKNLKEYLKITQLHVGSEKKQIELDSEKIAINPEDFLKKLDNVVSVYGGWKLDPQSRNFRIQMSSRKRIGDEDLSFGIYHKKTGLGINFNRGIMIVNRADYILRSAVESLVFSKLEDNDLLYLPPEAPRFDI